MKDNEQTVFKTIQHPMVESGIVPEVVRTYPTWIMRIHVFLNSCHRTFNERNLKRLEKGRNGVITSHILSIRPYSHLTYK